MTLADRLFTELPHREAERRAERDRAFAEAMRRFERRHKRQPVAPQSVEYALSGIAVLLWAGTIIMALHGLLAVLP